MTRVNSLRSTVDRQISETSGKNFWNLKYRILGKNFLDIDNYGLWTMDCGRNQTGAVLLVALIALVSLSLFGAALVSMVFWRSQMMVLEYDRLRAFYLAEAGISQALHELKTDSDPDADGVGNVSQTAFGAGVFEASYRPTERTITAQGVVNNTTRTIQVVFSNPK